MFFSVTHSQTLFLILYKPTWLIWSTNHSSWKHPLHFLEMWLRVQILFSQFDFYVIASNSVIMKPKDKKNISYLTYILNLHCKMWNSNNPNTFYELYHYHQITLSIQFNHTNKISNNPITVISSYLNITSI